MKNQHTPGPWENHCGEVTTPQINGRSYRRIAAVQDYGLGGLPEVDEANAHLISAAPDLLEALKELVDLNVARNMNRAKAAIAKAEGNQ